MCCEACTNHSISWDLNLSTYKTHGAGCHRRSPPSSQLSVESGNIQFVYCKLCPWNTRILWTEYFTFLKYFFSCNLKTILSFQSAWFFSSHQNVIPDIPTPNYPNVHQQNGEINWVHSFTEIKEKTTTATWINLDMTLYWAEDAKQNSYLISFQCSPRTG